MVAQGGVIRFVAEIFDQDIVRQYALGPSLQVSQFYKGESRLLTGPKGTFYWGTLRQKIKTPIVYVVVPPEIFEAGCSHMRGYLSAGALKILNGLEDEYFQDPPNLHWYTASHWHKHFRNGRTGRFKGTKPEFIPDYSHWAEGKDLFTRSYPKDWEIHVINSLSNSGLREIRVAPTICCRDRLALLTSYKFSKKATKGH
ncbi:hypothetical protein K438DRAFT_1771687 [Mycena galopus ATCC 62051]|nr:hypothetical protein K438DRAFT_1771687 [Mycena galopus ATCC 62051]